MASVLAYVTPRSSKNAILGINNGEVRVRVTAPPDDGKANKAVCKLFASSMGVPKSTVKVASGHASRHKRIATPLNAEQIDEWIASLPSA